MLEEALEHLVKGIVDHEGDVVVRTKNARHGDILEVRVHPDDLGRVIGRRGRTASALRTVALNASETATSGCAAQRPASARLGAMRSVIKRAGSLAMAAASTVVSSQPVLGKGGRGSASAKSCSVEGRLGTTRSARHSCCTRAGCGSRASRRAAKYSWSKRLSGNLFALLQRD